MLPKKGPSHPGEILKEIYLADMNMTQVELAKRIGCYVQKVNEIINGKRGVTPDFAVDLSIALGTSAEMWINLQAKYDLWYAVERRKQRLSA